MLKLGYKIQKIIREISPITHVSEDDPPIYMQYGMALGSPIPEDITERRSWALHHVIFGYTLKARLNALGIEADLDCPGSESRYKSIPEFFISNLSGGIIISRIILSLPSSVSTSTDDTQPVPLSE